MSQLHQDLKDIRISQKLSIEDVYDRTRITVENIEKIENGSIFDSAANKTYVRSFTRTYARALNISNDDMVHALDLSDIGSYSGYLRDKYLATEEKADDKQESDEKTETPSVIPQKQEEIKPVAPIPSVKDTKQTSSPKKKSSEAADLKASEKKEPEPKKARYIPSKSLGDKASERKKVDWSETNKKIHTQKQSNAGIIATIVVLLILLSVAVAVYVFVFSTPSDEQPLDITTPEETMTMPEEEADRIEIPISDDTIDAPIPPDPSLVNDAVVPDTLTIQVYAAYGNLEPFRVRSDTFENRRPYWVPVGEAMRLQFIDEITLFNHRDRMLILYDDRIITTFASENSAEQSVTITREQFINNPDLTNFTEPFPDDVSLPSVINDRPVIVN